MNAAGCSPALGGRLLRLVLFLFTKVILSLARVVFTLEGLTTSRISGRDGTDPLAGAALRAMEALVSHW